MAEREKARALFNRIAGHYDLLNHLLSFRIDKYWRKRAMKRLDPACKARFLDVACGTADFSIAAIRAGVQQVTGVDISEGMLELGREKIARCGLSERVSLEEGACEELGFPRESFSSAGIAFGIRNFENREKALREIFRVLEPGGQLVILEFSLPERFPVKQLYHFYFYRLLPWIGGLVSGNKEAYAYLPESVSRFPSPEIFAGMLREAGFSDCAAKRMSFGIAVLYTARKPLAADSSCPLEADSAGKS